MELVFGEKENHELGGVEEKREKKKSVIIREDRNNYDSLTAARDNDTEDANERANLGLCRRVSWREGVYFSCAFIEDEARDDVERCARLPNIEKTG